MIICIRIIFDYDWWLSFAKKESDWFLLDSVVFYFFSLSLLTHKRSPTYVVLYEYRKLDIHSPTRSISRSLAHSLSNTSFILCKNANMRMSKREKEEKKITANCMCEFLSLSKNKKEYILVEEKSFYRVCSFFISSHFYQSNWFWPFTINGIFIRFIVFLIHTLRSCVISIHSSNTLHSFGKWSFFTSFLIISFIWHCWHLIKYTCNNAICSSKKDSKSEKNN